MREYSRRAFAGFLAGLFLRPCRAAAHNDSPPKTTSRTYRADAIILLLGIPLYRRAGVGGGRAYMEETGEGDSLRRTFFFAGGSDPKRAHGLSRLGWMREVVQGPSAAPSEINYFGVLTSSPEESLEHARKSVAAPPSGRSVFSAVSGHHTPGHTRSAVTHFEFSTSATWDDRTLIDHAQATFNPAVPWRETAWLASPTQAPPSILLELATLLRQRTRHAVVGHYVYNDQEYQLELETQPAHDRLVPVKGKIRNLRTRFETPFRIWLEAGSGSVVPVRIEFQPRSFLRLTFEALPA